MTSPALAEQKLTYTYYNDILIKMNFASHRQNYKVVFFLFILYLNYIYEETKSNRQIRNNKEKQS